MKKFLLAAFILVDLALIGGSGYVLVTYIVKNLPKGSPSKASTTVATTMSSTGTAKLTGTMPEGSPGMTSPAAGDSNIRKILFSYRNSKASQVAIRADFTGWKAEPMQKATGGAWTYMAHLTPGEYAYCFTVGDKIINDPANKRTKVIGRTTVSSIVVEALPAKSK